MRRNIGQEIKRLSGLMALWATEIGMRGTRRLRRVIREEEGQGTTEYAVLVGVLVVIAIAAVVLFRDRIQSLWNDIANSINSL